MEKHLEELKGSPPRYGDVFSSSNGSKIAYVGDGKLWNVDLPNWERDLIERREGIGWTANVSDRSWLESYSHNLMKPCWEE